MQRTSNVINAGVSLHIYISRNELLLRKSWRIVLSPVWFVSLATLDSLYSHQRLEDLYESVYMTT